MVALLLHLVLALGSSDALAYVDRQPVPPLSAPAGLAARWSSRSTTSMSRGRHRGAGPSRVAATAAAAAAAPLPAPWGIDARDYGAVGDGVTDDARALEQAIAAAAASGQTLLLPAGRYLVNSTVNVPCNSLGTPAMDATCTPHPLRLVGAGIYLTSICAGRPMHAVLNFTALSGPTEGAAAPIPYENLYVGDIAIDAGGLANYSIFAPGIARSRFARVDISGALVTGLLIGYGWCDAGLVLPQRCRSATSLVFRALGDDQ
jgi:hypothetical protein